MNISQVEQLIKQLDHSIRQSEELKAGSQYDDLSDLTDDSRTLRAITANRAAIERASGRHSVYVKQVEEILSGPDAHPVQAIKISGVADALRADLKAGFLHGVEELLHAEIFGDFLEMADHLIEAGYKDAAAVIAGSALEAHLRQLCTKHGIDVVVTGGTGPRPKKADQMNADLDKLAAYSKLDQKSVTAWLDLRNKAAHGKYPEYSEEQVALLVTGVRDFITRNPA